MNILIAIIVNVLVGAVVCTILGTKDETFYKWYKKDITGGLICFFVLIFWPVRAYVLIRYRKKVS